METHGTNITILVETWVSREHISRIMTDLSFASCYLVESVGFAGDILLLCNPKRVTIYIKGESPHGVHGLVEVHNPHSVLLSSMYTSIKFEKRKLSWNGLIYIACNVNLTCFVKVDFNENYLSK